MRGFLVEASSYATDNRSRLNHTESGASRIKAKVEGEKSISLNGGGGGALLWAGLSLVSVEITR